MIPLPPPPPNPPTPSASFNIWNTTVCSDFYHIISKFDVKILIEQGVFVTLLHTYYYSFKIFPRF